MNEETTTTDVSETAIKLDGIENQLRMIAQELHDLGHEFENTPAFEAAVKAVEIAADEVKACWNEIVR